MKNARMWTSLWNNSECPRGVSKLSSQNFGWRSFSLSLSGVIFLSGISFQHANEDVANLSEPTLWFVLLQAVAR